MRHQRNASRHAHRGRDGLAGAIVLAVAAWSSVARAEPPQLAPTCPCPEEVARSLAGHRFVPFIIVDWPFIDSDFVSTSSLGIFRLELEPLPIVGRVLRDTDGDVVAAAQSFRGSWAITRWLGINARLTAAEIVAIDVPSAFEIGAHGAYGGDGGVALRLIRSERFQLTARFDVGWAKTEGVLPSRLPSSPLTEGRIFTTARPAAAAALTLAPWLGLQASFSAARRQRDLDHDGDDTSWLIAGAVGASLVLAPLPILFEAGYELSDEEGRDLNIVSTEILLGAEDLRHRGELGIYYHGHADLDLGAAVTFELTDDDRRGMGHVRLAYYF